MINAPVLSNRFDFVSFQILCGGGGRSTRSQQLIFVSLFTALSVSTNIIGCTLDRMDCVRLLRFTNIIIAL